MKRLTPVQGFAVALTVSALIWAVLVVLVVNLFA